MKIGLVAGIMRENQLENQLAEIESYMRQCSGYDLICFGESFLQGFEGLTWDFTQDRSRGLLADSAPIHRLVHMAEAYECGVSFGFIEREGEVLYSSYMVINKRGKVVDLFRRVSDGWKEPHADLHYQEGDGFHFYRVNGQTLATAICGDLWAEENIAALGKLQYDLLLLPLYVDYSAADWENKTRAEYAAQAAKVGKPVLMVNSWVEKPGRAKGGSAVFENGEVVAELPIGAPGILRLDLHDGIFTVPEFAAAQSSAPLSS